MGDCYITRRGGGGGLNFNVIAYTSELLLPATAKENTIAVITDTPITGWSFSAAEPTTPYEGMVWFITEYTAVSPFNASKKNELNVYPNKATQYVNGKWVNAPAYIYKDGAWAEIFFYDKIYIFKDGKLNTDFVQSLDVVNQIGKASISYGSNYIYLNAPENKTHMKVATNKVLPTSKFNTLCVDMSASIRSDVDDGTIVFGIDNPVLYVQAESFSRTKKTLDISNVTTDCAIYFSARAWDYRNNYAQNYYYNAWLE